MKTDSTKSKIMMSAGPIFAEKGFKASTVREICDSAGVNIASVNYYFGDKQQLYHETVILAREMRARQFPEPLESSETEPEKRLYDFVFLLLNRLMALQNEPWQLRLLMREILQPTETCKTLVEEHFRPFFRSLLKTVDDLAEGELAEYERVQIGFSIVGQCMYYRFAAGVTDMMIDDENLKEHFAIEKIADHIAAFSLAAIRERKTKGEFALKPGS